MSRNSVLEEFNVNRLALSRVVSEIFNVEKYCDLEIPVKSQLDH